MRLPRARLTAFAVLAAACLTPPLLAAPAGAAPGCLSEDSGNLLLPFACDDTAPPETAISARSTDGGWSTSSTVRFAFAGSYADGDTGALGYECRLTGPGRSDAWSACTSPVEYSGLADADDPYTFAVRAHDVDDAAIAPSALEIGETDSNPAEVDTTPATATFRVDTVNPTGYLIGGPRDSLTPANPVTWSRTVRYTVGASETPVSLACRLDGALRACSRPTWTLSGLTRGQRTATLRVTDPAGNSDPVLRTQRFTVPANIIGTATQLRGWRRVTASGGYFSGDYYEASRRFATLSRANTTISELRVRYPKGPGLGSFRIAIGGQNYRIIDQAASTRSVGNVAVIRGPQQQRLTGTLKLFVTSDGKPVRIDAIMWR